MDELVKKLDSLASRSKLSKKNLAEAVDALWHFYELNQDEVATASYLMQFKPEVAYHFYTRAASSWEEAEARRVYQAFTATAGYTKNIKNAGTGRAFAIAAALLQQQKEYARDFLSQALAQVERKGQYSQSVLVLFAQQIEALVGWEELERLHTLPWDNEEGQRVWLNLS
ncbi:MAG: hypothetical protein FWF06_07930, partial [Symbiobacteriaceae bacterium]|nr:hypothetical protein [Symbiobacteriaceae bacterium]